MTFVRALGVKGTGKGVVSVDLLGLTVRFPWVCCHSEIWIKCLLWVENSL